MLFIKCVIQNPSYFLFKGNKVGINVVCDAKRSVNYQTVKIKSAVSDYPM